MDRKKTGVTHLDIFKKLNKSNCRKCGLPTCLAFALAVIQDEKKMSDCPYLDATLAEELEKGIVKRGKDKDLQRLLEPLKRKIRDVDFAHVARGLGADIEGERLRVKCLGKNFYVDRQGNVESIIHINTWVVVPLLHYIITGGSARHTGRWVSFEDLKKASTVTQYFDRRCEDPLRMLAESHTALFFDLLKIFGSRQVEGFNADHACVILPMPRVPFLILYWKPEEQFPSKLKILFDSTADQYLDVEFIIALGRGIVEMCKRILSRHEEVMPSLLSM
jgi:hypothetical protein